MNKYEFVHFKRAIIKLKERTRHEKLVYLRTIKGLRKGQSVQKKMMNLTSLENSRILMEKVIPDSFSKEDEVLVIHMKGSLYSKEMHNYMESFQKYAEEKGITSLFAFDLYAYDIKVTKENRELLIRFFEDQLKRLKNEKEDFTIHVNDDGGIE